KAEDDDDEEMTESDNDDDEDSDNDVEGANVAGNEAVKDTNTDLDGRDKVMTDVEDTHVGRDAEMTDVILPQVQATQETEDTHVT
ncbi:hypothetical protein Tco_0504146, partial [Tanacetum coccineum]